MVVCLLAWLPGGIMVPTGLLGGYCTINESKNEGINEITVRVSTRVQ